MEFTLVADADEQIEMARVWMADCIGLGVGETVTPLEGVRYVTHNYPGGWTAFVDECCTFFFVSGMGAPVM